MSNLVHMAPIEMARLFGELVQCLYGDGPFSADTVEVYAYRFGIRPAGMPISPGSNEARKSALALHDLLTLFLDAHGAIVHDIHVDGVPLAEWIEAGELEHRVKVAVLLKQT